MSECFRDRSRVLFERLVREEQRRREETKLFVCLTFIIVFLSDKVIIESGFCSVFETLLKNIVDSLNIEFTIGTMPK